MKHPISHLVIVMGALLVSAAGFAQSSNEPKADAYPIIAQLYGDPPHYRGKTVVIYGLVIETSPDGSFMLQDVSQRPMKIVPNKSLKASVGDQLMVFGTFRSARTPYVRAKSLIATQVLAGGGCC